MSKIKFYKDSAKTHQVYPELDPEDITKFESLEDIENAFPNVSGEDTNLTLNHTVEAPMRLELAPSELEQETTTGKNLWRNIPTETTDGITLTNNGDGSYTLNGTSTKNTSFYIEVNYPAGNYTISANNPVAGTTSSFYIQAEYNGGPLRANLNLVNSNKTKSVTSTIHHISIVVPINLTLTNFVIKPQLEQGITATDFEPYTGGQPSPSPEFPMDIHTISGDNEIKVVNKNFAYLKDGTYTKENDTAIINNNLITLNTSSSTGSNSYFSFGNGYTQTWAPAGNGIKNVNDLKLTGDGGNYIATIYTNKTISGSISFRIYTSNNRELMTNIGSYMTSTINISLEDGEHIKDYGLWSGTASIFNDYQMRVQLEKGTTATPYIPHQEQSLPLNLPVENLFDKDNVEIGDIDTTTGGDVSNDNVYRTKYIQVQSNTNYTLNFNNIENNKRIFLYNKDKVLINTTLFSPAESTKTILTTSGTKYVRFKIVGTQFDEHTQLEEGTKANSYTPYGTQPLEYCKIGTYSDEFFKNDPSDPNYDSSLELNRWYLKKNVGKVILDGSENISLISTAKKNTNLFAFNSIVSKDEKFKEKSNRFQTGKSFYMLDEEGLYLTTSGMRIRIKKTTANSLNDFKSWLSTHNTEVYYLLVTPQYILLSDTLQHQLDDIYNWVESYPGQTNISQINNDLPFIISARAMKDLSVIDKYPTENSEHLVESGGVYEVVNDINERIADIDTIRHNSKNVVYGSETGANIYLDDAYDTNLVELSVDGICEQETTTGKNLFKPLNITNNGITTTYDKNGVGTIKGTSTNNWANISTEVLYSYPAGNYVLSIDKPKTFNVIIKGAYTDKEIFEFAISAGSKTKNVEFKKEVYRMYAYINGIEAGATFNETIKIQLEKGSTATDYEPYTGGQPSPSPDYPQEIKTIENSLKITSCNKNLIDLSEFFDTTLNGITITNNRDGSLTLNGTATGNIITPIIKYKYAKESEFGIYTFKCFGLPSNCYNDVWYGSPRPYGEGICRVEYKNKTDNYAITLNIPNGTSLTNVIIRPILVKGSYTSNNFPSFEQHLQSQITANLPEGEFIGKINDTYKDTLNIVYKDDGHYHLMLNKMIGKVVLDGSENWIITTPTHDGFTRYSVPAPAIKGQNLAISSHFIVGDTASTSVTNLLEYRNTNYIFINTDIASALEDFKTWLSTHNTEVYYALATSYEVDLGIVDMPITYKNISHITNSEDANMSITYVKDINIVINKLTNAVVSLGGNI
ncbi:MAG: hypothetical protein MSA56_05745 [Clostridium sp.]|nr:hypothetical protein [Clostridium sp.]